MTDWKPSAMIKQFLDERDVFTSSRNTYKKNLLRFFYWVHKKKIEPANLSRPDLIAYKNELKDAGLSIFTINSYMGTLRIFFEWMDEMGYHDNVAYKLKSLKRPGSFARESLSPEQARDLLSSIDRDTLPGLRDYCIIYLMLSNGLREVEITRLLVSDFVVEEKTPGFRLWRKGHISKDVFHPVTDETKKLIESYLAYTEGKGDSPLFFSASTRNPGKALTTKTISEMVKKYLRKIGIDDPKYTAHSLRHTAATLALEGGVDLYDVQLFMGHSSPQTTTIYFRSRKRKQLLKNEAGKIISAQLKERTIL
ncbi:MAG: tyrosine-type recombinase/integrase [Deltaproteobacteria bacterium]|nr:tyrosine-type recombinase/integrase [Deltaproteobacteria bacterium]